jgi:hypothetical protein
MNQSSIIAAEVNYFTECLRSLNDDNEEVSALRQELNNLISVNIQEFLTIQSVSSKCGVFKFKDIRDRIAENVAREVEKKIVFDHLYSSVKTNPG